MGLTSALGSGPVAADSSIFISFIEGKARFTRAVRPLFEEADQGFREIVTSGVTLLEVLVTPYRVGNARLAEHYEALLTRSRGVRLVEVTHDQLRLAAQLRAATSVRTPDSLQIAAALTAGCRTFLTHDRRLPPMAGIRVLQLSAFLPPA